MNYSLLRSKTFWTIVLAFVVNGYAAISGQVPAGVDMIVNLVLSSLASYFHVVGVKTAALASAGGTPSVGQ